jgi:hypothetical protein
VGEQWEEVGDEWVMTWDGSYEPPPNWFNTTVEESTDYTDFTYDFPEEEEEQEEEEVVEEYEENDDISENGDEQVDEDTQRFRTMTFKDYNMYHVLNPAPEPIPIYIDHKENLEITRA